MEILAYVLLGCAALILLAYLAWRAIGDALIDFQINNHTPFVLVERDDNHATFATEFDVVNSGKQCATIMDCFIRQQLPYEQYDGVTVRGKAELLGAARPDDYFEAVLIQKGEKIRLKALIELTAAKGKNLTQAVEQIVDIPVDIVYQHTGRHIAALSKKRLVLPASKIAALLQAEGK